jgi:hypothetical protein
MEPVMSAVQTGAVIHGFITGFLYPAVTSVTSSLPTQRMGGDDMDLMLKSSRW